MAAIKLLALSWTMAAFTPSIHAEKYDFGAPVTVPLQQLPGLYTVLTELQAMSPATPGYYHIVYTTVFTTNSIAAPITYISPIGGLTPGAYTEDGFTAVTPPSALTPVTSGPAYASYTSYQSRRNSVKGDGGSLGPSPTPGNGILTASNLPSTVSSQDPPPNPGDSQSTSRAASLASSSTVAAAIPTSSNSGASAGSSSQSVSSTPAKKSNIGAIVGGVVGGVAALAILLGLLLLLARRRKHKKSAAAIASKEGAYGMQEHTSSTPDIYGGTAYQPAKTYEPQQTYLAQSSAEPAYDHSRAGQTEGYPALATASAAAPVVAPVAQHPQRQSQAMDVHMPMSREVNSDGVSLRSVSPDPDDMAQRHSFEATHGERPAVPRLPLNSGAERRGPAL